MTEDERRALLEKMQASFKEAKRMTPEQARQRLAEEDRRDHRGTLSADARRLAARG